MQRPAPKSHCNKLHRVSEDPRRILREQRHNLLLISGRNEARLNIVVARSDCGSAAQERMKHSLAALLDGAGGWHLTCYHCQSFQHRSLLQAITKFATPYDK